MTKGVAQGANGLEKITDEELIKKYRAGANEAVEILVQRYKRLVRAKIRSTYFVGIDKDDLIQEGMIGLFKAICDYNPDKEASFSSFANLCVTRQVSTAFKSVSRQKHIPLNTSISLSVPINAGEDDDEITLIDTLKNNRTISPEDEIIGMEDLETLNNQIEKILSKLEKEVLWRYVNGENYHEIAKAMNKEPKSIDNALQRIKKKIEVIRK